MEGEFLPPLITLFSNEADSLDSPEVVLGNVELRKEELKSGETGIARLAAPELFEPSGSMLDGTQRVRHG